MRSNDEIIAVLTELKDSKNMSLSELARRVGMAKSALSRYFNKTREFPLNRADDFAKALDTTPEHILGFEKHEINHFITASTDEKELISMFRLLEHERQHVVLKFTSDQLDDQNSVINLAEQTHTYIAGRSTAAGAPIDGDAQDSNATVVKSTEVPTGADELVTIAGDSMEPILAKGSQVFIHWQPVVENGEIAVVSIEDDGVTCKKFYLEGDKIRLVSL
ncbi:LexA family transcriptional regulator [Loigolactobacillus coryniformis]|uniref:LexA family transcriptional regulator n=1 Tax=Loigolactobacillus coryniformis TaxID=1610 RepID=UPI001F01C1AA|nr:LexA family transcriptional regulator [Loigolactobacillus coryniformis]